ncbi:MAG TPA: N-acetylmuramoyl-L-alanine amidase [Geobacteraceae bacterium]|nr:N-acetylmuramoyl-L-alanine amidase [Geobacteraceae bacterium]
MLRKSTLFSTALFILLFAFNIYAEESGKGSLKSHQGKKASAAAKKKKKTAKSKPVKAAKKAKKLLPAAVDRPQVSTAQLTDIRHWTTPDYTRIAVTLSHDAPYETHEIAKTPGSGILSRIFFDVNGAKLAPGVKDITIGDGFLKSVRVAQYKADTVRVVLDVDNIKEYKIFTFSDPFRIIVDVKGERRAEISSLTPALTAAPVSVAPVAVPVVPAVKPPPSVLPEAPKEPPAIKPAPRQKIKPGKIRRIVVDPGHGGKDPGAIGHGGLQEKDVVLSMGLILARKLKDELGIDAVMTRSTDVFIELQERTAIANQVGADLFVSLHANASLNRSASGMEVYYLNLAKTEKAAQLAARENGTSLEKVSLLQAVLFDLMANYKLNDSAHLAEEVQKALYKRMSGSYPATKNLGVKQGPFYVLVGATMPSILVESAFISNEKEEARLKDPAFHEQVAEGVLEGIVSYISSLK